MTTDCSKTVLDVAIIGGGVSGVYTGMRLLSSERSELSHLPTGKLEVALFEQSDRIGGRLLSLEPPGIPTTRVEVGGMRYTSEHKWVLDLVGHFDLTPVEFPVQKPQNLAYLRGHRLRISELTDSSKLPYSLQGYEQSESDLADGFTAVAARKLLQTMTGKEIDLAEVDWQHIASKYQFEGMNLADLPIRYLMQRMISHEAYAFAVESSGYDSILYTWNGADGFPWNLGDFGASITYYRLAEGYQMIPLKLCEEFEKDGGQVNYQHNLKDFDLIDLEDGTRGVEFCVEHAGGETTHVARNLVLAMPRRSLELIKPTGAVMEPCNSSVRSLIESVTPIPLFKLALCYSRAWWEDVPPQSSTDESGNVVMQKITSGESVTDLPVRQIYYWAKDEATGNAVVLIYDDGLALTYWAGLRDQHEMFENSGSGTQPADQLSNWDDFPAPKRMVEDAHRQLLKIHGLSGQLDVPEPYSAAYSDWGKDPYGGGANFWHVGVKSHEVSRDIVQPMKEVPVFICGESYSHAQGWVEGALATTEDMLQHHLGLMPPMWAKQI
jgi:monoamine oxidase